MNGKNLENLEKTWVAPNGIPAMILKGASLKKSSYWCKFKRFTIYGSLDFKGLGVGIRGVGA